jgi:hypothetical protein
MPIYRRKLLTAGIFFALSLPIVAYDEAEHTKQVKKLPAGENVIWNDPGDVARLDFIYGVGGQQGSPAPPFHFLEEDLGGTTPKVKVRDAKGREWSVKFGVEAKPSVFSTRLAWACGYTVETEYLVGHGVIEGTHGLKRAKTEIQGDGSFIDARFQLRSDSPKFVNGYNWSWNSNPFVGSHELNGLKILVMLLSNWDTKDDRDFSGSGAAGLADSNLAIYQTGSSDRPRYLYFVSDWGASLGQWGPMLMVRKKWNCSDYAAQTPNFIQGQDNDAVHFGFVGKHNESIVNGVRASDVQWLLRYLGQVTDEQLRQGLASSGAAPDELECYLTQLRTRIDQLKRIQPPQ